MTSERATWALQLLVVNKKVYGGERGVKDGRGYADENVMRAMRLNAAKNMDTHEFVCALITLKNFSQEI